LKWSELVLPTVDAPAGDGTWLIYGECNDCAPGLPKNFGNAEKPLRGVRADSCRVSTHRSRAWFISPGALPKRPAWNRPRRVPASCLCNSFRRWRIGSAPILAACGL
jgi:hypothetical protein